ncbi:MAG TPA: tyrosine-type recombinase/integrase [Bryobacteraceae bacterium]|nr:tyrosine-type recombinase/integrase [Bryobacteraceae bacterium]HPU74401.1 tyrosine-type recombinase/integrase [Bryobacteraceae bacterium]
MGFEGNLQALAGGLRVKARVQHPKVTQRKDRPGWPWIFRYYEDEIQPDGSTKVLRRYHEIAPSKGDGAISKKQAEIERDKFLAKLNAPTAEEAVQQVAATGVALFGEVARMYEEGYLGRVNQIAKPTRVKEKFYLDEYIVPRWGKLRLNQIQPKAVEDWLHTTFDSWWTMHGVRAIMSRVFYYAEGHGLWEEGKRSPASKAKLGKKRYKNERRILSFDETARVLARLEEPNKLIIETCIATGARISEVLGLKWRHVNLDAATIKIEQRVWHQDVGRPKSEDSRRILGIGDLAARFREKAAADGAKPDAWVFHQKRDHDKPLWDSGVRDALHQAAAAEGCDFPGLGPHSFRRANITWRQEVGGSAIEASKIAGHADLEMTGEYTFVAPERQNELTRRIQAKLADAGHPARKIESVIREVEAPPTNSSPARDGVSVLDGLALGTQVVQ